jgi:hypothetical protein
MEIITVACDAKNKHDKQTHSRQPRDLSPFELPLRLLKKQLLESFVLLVTNGRGALRQTSQLAQGGCHSVLF